MTSTVLDVTVLLLCVSASVVVLGGVDVGPPSSQRTAADAADRLTTETATVRYTVDDESDEANARRSVHATLVELLSAAVSVETDTDATAARFRSLALETVADALGPRTRVDVRRPARPVNRTATTTTPDGETPSGETHDGETPDGETPGDEARDDRVTAVSEEAATLASVGSSPPRDADVSVAVVRHPTSVARAGSEPLRIVVRVW